MVAEHIIYASRDKCKQTSVIILGEKVTPRELSLLQVKSCRSLVPVLHSCIAVYLSGEYENKHDVVHVPNGVFVPLNDHTGVIIHAYCSPTPEQNPQWCSMTCMHLAQVFATSQSRSKFQNLYQFLAHVNAVSCPTVFDLGGGEVRFSGNMFEKLAITGSGVTLRDGSIWLSDFSAKDGPVLLCSSKQLTMENITITGGCEGLSLLQGSNVTLRDCSFTNQWICVRLANSSTAESASSLIANGINFTCFTSAGIKMNGGHVSLTGCEISGGKGTSENGKLISFLTQRGSDLRGGLICKSGGKALLIRCSFKDNECEDVRIDGADSSVVLTACDMDKEPITSNSGKVSYEPKVRNLELHPTTPV